MKLASLITATLVCVIATTAQAQGRRTITPVKPNTNTIMPPARNMEEAVIQQFLDGDTLSVIEAARKDSIAKNYPRYPSINEVTFGLNFIDPILMLFGQSYGGVDLNVSLNMWNRLQPSVDFGVAMANNTPDGMNFTYHTALAPYARIGVNYNFLFKKQPQYQILAGLRLGASQFTYDVTDVSLTDSYWGESADFSLLNLSSNALWCEALLGLRVQLSGAISMGWQAKWHSIISYKQDGYSKPWFIPGYGTTANNLGIAFNIYYTLPLNKKKWPIADNDKPNNNQHSIEPPSTEGAQR